MIALRSVTSIRGVVGRDEIEQLSLHVRAEHRVYYPYFWFVFRDRGRPCHCLVDARTGQVATADLFQTEPCDVPEDIVLDVAIVESAACGLARRYVGRTRHRIPKLVERGLVHKPFWILSFSSPSGSHFRMLADGITGKVHPLVGRTTEPRNKLQANP